MCRGASSTPHLVVPIPSLDLLIVPSLCKSRTAHSSHGRRRAALAGSSRRLTVAPRTLRAAADVVKFPQGATAVQKARLLSALHLIDFNFFERRANQK